MHNIKYSRGVKVVAVILQTILVVVTVVACSVCFSYQGNSKGTGDMLEGKRFIESAYYESLVEEELYGLSDYVHLCTIFETGGAYDSDKLISVEDYVKRNVAYTSYETEEEVIYYRLEDLIKWGKEGIVYDNLQVEAEEEESHAESTIQYTKVYDNSSEDGELISEKTIQLPDTIRDGEVQTLKYLKEYYLPVDGISLADRFHSDKDREQFYEYLESAIVKMKDDFEQYKTFENKYYSKNTNVHYAVVDTDLNEIYTNVREISDVYMEQEGMLLEDFVQYFNAYGTKFFMNSVSMGYETDLGLGNERFLEIMRRWNNSMTGNYYIAMAVDTNFIAQDNLYQEKTEYEKIQPWYRIACISAIISMALAFVLFIYLTFVSGHKDSTETISLCWFDKIKTEIASLIMFFVALLEILIVQGARGDYEFGLWNNIIVGIAAFIANLSFLAGYFSLVRRIKAETLWTNSVLYRISSFLLRVFRNRKNTTRILILYSSYVLTNAVWVGLGIVYNNLWIGFGVPMVISIISGVYIVKDAMERHEIINGVSKIVDGDLDYKIDTVNLHQDNYALAQSINNIGAGLRFAVEESTRNERMKTELITNVSHDIKTPLTSIINYVGLIKREKIDNERIQSYVEVLENKAQRLKHLTEDLVEASKISSGNIELQIGRINLVELIYQTAGEFDEKFDAKNLNIVLNIPKEPVVVMADGRRVWRVIENLYNNVAKYALSGTRVYADLVVKDEKAIFSLKNISENQLNFDATELTERFIRGDVSRSTEGSGLGLSIAKNLTELQGGEFEIYLDGDLFRVTVTLPMALEEAETASEMQE